MVAAAIVTFGILLAAWLLAPDDGAPRSAASAPEPLELRQLAA